MNNKKLPMLDWFQSLTEEKIIEVVRLHTRHKDYTSLYYCLTPEDIQLCWIQEVVLPWWNKIALYS